MLNRLLPPDDDAPPSTTERIRFLVTVCGPWIALYEITVALHLRGRAFQFAFEDNLPVISWTALIYQSIYVVVAVSPWIARTRRDLRRLTISVWLSLMLVFPIYWIVPSRAPRRAMAVSNWIGKVLQWERNTYPPTAAFPSFHALWVIFIARLFRPLWIGVAYAAAVILSCVTTGMHFIPDLLASLVLAPLFLYPERIWRRVRGR